MLLVIPVSLSDRHLIPFVERAFEMFPPGSGHQLLVVGSPNVMQDVAELAQKLCIHFAGNAKTHIFETDSALGWPTNCNYYFQQVVFYLPSFIQTPGLWFWFELDSTPLKAGWMDEIETVCTIERAKSLHDEAEPPKFFGLKERTYQEFRGELLPIEEAGEHMAPCGVYPSDMIDWVLTLRAISATNVPWYCFIQWYVLNDFQELPILQNNWKTGSYERNADGQITCQSEANWAWDKHFNDPIAPSTVLVHGCKDGSLTELLHAEYEMLKDEGVPVAEYWTDYHEGDEREKERLDPIAPRKKRITRAQVDAARQRLMKMHEARRAAALAK
jgi:hypothetical protein